MGIKKQKEITKLLRKLPYIGNRLKNLKLHLKNIFYKFFNKEDSRIFVDVGANVSQTIEKITMIFPNPII